MIGRDNGADGWCILRTKPGATIRLAQSLARANIETWTPIAVTSRLRTRLGSRRLPKPMRIEQTLPITPSLVFVRAFYLPRVAAMAIGQPNQHPPFSLYRHAGRIPILADRSIAGLREAEERARVAITKERDDEDRERRREDRIALMRTEREKRKALRTERRVFGSGQAVTVSDAPAFAGMTGVIEKGDGRSYFVSFGGSLRLEIEAWRLSPHDVDAGVTVCA